MRAGKGKREGRWPKPQGHHLALPDRCIATGHPAEKQGQQRQGDKALACLWQEKPAQYRRRGTEIEKAEAVQIRQRWQIVYLAPERHQNRPFRQQIGEPARFLRRDDGVFSQNPDEIMAAVGDQTSLRQDCECEKRNEVEGEQDCRGYRPPGFQRRSIEAAKTRRGSCHGRPGRFAGCQTTAFLFSFTTTTSFSRLYSLASRFWPI